MPAEAVTDIVPDEVIAGAATPSTSWKESKLEQHYLPLMFGGKFFDLPKGSDRSDCYAAMSCLAVSRSVIPPNTFWRGSPNFFMPHEHHSMPGTGQAAGQRATVSVWSGSWVAGR